MRDDLVLVADDDGVRTITLNDPKRLNGWTQPMMAAMRGALGDAAADEAVRVVILTGTGRYYCAGVNLGGTIKLSHPRTLHRLIVEHNQALFESFLQFPKPILVAVNGPAIGASVTSATLCDGIIASEAATFSTPFAALGVAEEGCSSVHFARLMGEDNARRMLGPEGWKPNGAEAAAIGLAQWVAPPDRLMAEAQAIARGWVESDKRRELRGGSQLDELLAVNARESVAVADSFLSPPFLKGQFKFLWSKKKRGPALMFLGLWATHPVWSRLRS